MLVTAATKATTSPFPSEQAHPSLQRASGALVAVGVLFLVLQQVLMSPLLGLSVDEADYLAKVNPSVPELYWSHVRAWGVPVLAAPIAVFSPGTGAVRLYFSALSSIGLVGAFWPWRRVLRPAVAPLAALLFATTWFTLLFGVQVMPNLYVALGAVATTGLFLRAVQTGDRARTVAAGAAAGLVALVRPTDSLLLLAGVLGCALVVPRLRRPGPLGALAVGGLLGWLPWVVEAYQRFDGPLARFQGGNSQGLKGGVTPNLTNLQTYPRILDGHPTYCCYGGPAAEAGPLPVLLTVWFVAVPLLALFGLAAAARQQRLAETMLAVAPAGLFAGFYLLLLPFASARFLLPICALLSLPVAAGLVALVAGQNRSRILPAVLVGVVLAGHLGLMLPQASREFSTFAQAQERHVRVADALRPLVTGQPCVLISAHPQVPSYYLGCRPQRVQPSKVPPTRVRTVQEQGGLVLAVLPKPPPPGSYLASWRPVPLPQLGRRWAAYLPPR